MSESKSYMSAMLRGDSETCGRIEQRHDLYGYPPEIVSIGLAAFDEGKDVQAAVAAYISADAS